jgi:D-tyrosyl-tRNA(Tyr) deacylase
MRIVLQRVKEAQVTTQEEGICGKIRQGLLVFLGIHKDDQADQTLWLVNKLIQLRIFSDENGKMNRSVQDINGEVLVVSQFTLYGNCSNGRRPDFVDTAPPAQAEALYEKFVQEVQKELGHVQKGQFGALMEVSLVNDGPVTFILEN